VQARERKALAAAVEGLDRRRLILAGDFNTTPWSHAMRSQDAMLAPLRRWTIAWPTWPARLPQWKLTWLLPLLPIDHIYAGPAWTQVRLRRVRLPGSDHFATEASLSRIDGDVRRAGGA
jgi:endonuclease/exonuclease/phosphatase (EEP) superfamily protein YafD